MSYTVTISFKSHYNYNTSRVNEIIDHIPPFYKAGHTQAALGAELHSKGGSYDIEFPNKNVANKFAVELFENMGNLLDIQRNYR